MSWQQASFSIALGLCVGCAEHLRALDHSAGWSTGVLFWPPPRSTAMWTAESSSSTLGDAAQLIAGTLRGAGYADQRWFPVGAHYEHGFAVSTRLEKIAEGGTPKSAADRWTPQYPDAASLRWLAGAVEPYLPAPGRYRVMLVAFTELGDAPPPGQPQRWDESTAMEGPDFRAPELPARRRAPPGCRVRVYIYEYETSTGDHDGALVAHDDKLPAEAHVEMFGLLPVAPRRP